MTTIQIASHTTRVSHAFLRRDFYLQLSAPGGSVTTWMVALRCNHFVNDQQQCDFPLESVYHLDRDSARDLAYTLARNVRNCLNSGAIINVHPSCTSEISALLT